MTRLGKNKGPTICSPVGYFSFDRRHKVQGIKKKKKRCSMHIERRGTELELGILIAKKTR